MKDKKSILIIIVLVILLGLSVAYIVFGPNGYKTTEKGKEFLDDVLELQSNLSYYVGASYSDAFGVYSKDEILMGKTTEGEKIKDNQDNLLPTLVEEDSVQDYGKDLSGLSPTIGSSTVSDDVHYTGLVAEATGSTNRGPSTNAIARRLDKALRHVQIQRVTNTRYGQGDINGLYRINGMDKGSAYFGTENVAIPITNKAVNDVLKDIDDDKLYKMGISKQQLGKNKAQYYIIPVTKVNYNIDAVYSSGNSATRKRLGGVSNAYPSLGYDQNAGQNTFNRRRQ